MPPKILVIDDEIEIVELIQGWLSHIGYEVITAHDGHEGLWQIKSKKPDLVLLDALIPGKTGYEILGEMKKQEAIRDIPVIMMSGRPSMTDTEGEAFAFVGKPFEPKDMLEKIRKALREKS